MRVAVTQFATSSNCQENLASCIRMIDEAALCKPSLIVLPEFCNTNACYDDHNQAWDEALATNGAFLQQVAQQAKKYHCYIVLNVTLRRDLTRDHQNAAIKSNITITSCVFSPLGGLVYQGDKHKLTEHENEFFICLSKDSEVVVTAFGKLGFLAGSDSNGFAASHELAIRGAQLLCNSQNSYALEQSALHDPARAYENNVFLATANKIGSHLAKELVQFPLEKSALLTMNSATNDQYLMAVGQSQIVAPDGKVLAKVANNEEGYVFADIALTEAGFNNKCRPDGTEQIKQRRPELYQSLAKQQTAQHAQFYNCNTLPETANVAIFATYKSNEQAIEDVCHYIENNLSDIIQLPELFFIADKTITNTPAQRVKIACLSTELIKQISAVLRPLQYVCTSLIIEGTHQAVLISEHGLYARQQQLHFCKRYQWTTLGDELNIITLPLEQGNINIAMLTADDANMPEIVKVAALNNIQVLLVPFDIQVPCEVEYSLLSRAAENSICIVAASREKSFADDLATNNDNDSRNQKKVKTHKSTGLIIDVTKELALENPLKSAGFHGFTNKTVVNIKVKHQHGKITKAVIHPIAAGRKFITT